MNNLDILFELLAYEGSPSNDPADAIKVVNRSQETNYTAVSRQKIQVPNLATDIAITLPDPSSDCLVILADQDISIKLNGGSAEALKTRQSGKKTLVYYRRGPTTALSVSNASGKTVALDIILANK